MNLRIPLSPNQLGGPFVTATDRYEVLAHRDGAVIIRFYERPAEIEWFENFELLYCREQHDRNTVKVIRAASDEERQWFRIPLWLQGDEVPQCCGRDMFFVGQIDDDWICSEPPEGATMWWHDKAAFYVFTCSQCLECKAIGQQY